MKKMQNLRRLFTEQELVEDLQKANVRLDKELKKKDFTIATFYSFDIAYIYELLGNKKKAEHHYQNTLRYLDHADFKFLRIRIECLRALGKHKEALEAALDDSHYTKLGLAKLYEKAGKPDVAREIYTELAIEHSKKAIESMFFKPHFLQYASDLWERAQNLEKARKYNERAVEAWERMRDKKERPLHTIEEAWLYEEVGYIYEKADKFEIAMEYYEKSKEIYELAYEEDPAAVYTHQVDGDWDYYKEIFFYLQLFGTRIFKLRVENPMKYDYRRIRYRILNLKEQMKK